ncbi:LOW QUALITY PROTEIN: hypothetical protein OSB04_022074 [Centaurea solstitialis]|uniref:Reverse transcriptase zinc-binding domain-containing protein n=1 Tax=Centaurea solstitialis TaxID=347529 RepID=A0AA38WIC6_9ASTR|nr:LOW QUALITY PROTEIN: hypothetical protein OSB04_022074 [Centaurea solstitialis]
MMLFGGKSSSQFTVHTGVWRSQIRSDGIQGFTTLLIIVNIPLNSWFVRQPGLDNVSDRLEWALEPSGVFLVASMRKAFDEFYLQKVDLQYFFWNNWIQKKVCLHAWRIAHGRLGMKTNLQKRGEAYLHQMPGVEIGSAGSRWNVNVNRITNLHGLLDWGASLNFKCSKLKLFMATLYTYLWMIWKMRNGKVFQGAAKEKGTIILSQIQAFSYFWVRHRASNCNLANNWVEWCNSPSSGGFKCELFFGCEREYNRERDTYRMTKRHVRSTADD